MWAVRMEDVSKRYPRGGATYAHFGTEIAALGRRAAARLAGRTPAALGKLALDGVSLEVEQGESFALVGRNGAGKSTALRLISRISYPTAGQVRVRGRVGALIEVGSGIHPELTGRENVWLYGTILGIPRDEIRRRFDSIVEFAQLGSSMETQVKYFSSGMQLRLGFSIAAHLEPEVFVIDEALSVGDASFQSRAVGRMRELLHAGTTLVFVSHDLTAVETLCRRAALLDEGRVTAVGDVRSVLAAYLERVEGHGLAADEADGAPVRVVSASCHGANGEERTRFSRRDRIELRLRFAGTDPVVRPHITVGISDGRPDYPLIEMSMLDDDTAAPELVSRSWECRLMIDALPLRPRLYEIWCEVLGEDGFTRLADWRHVASVRIEEGAAASGLLTVVNSALAGPVAVDHNWAFRDLTADAE